jgi:hypothetical protein
MRVLTALVILLAACSESELTFREHGITFTYPASFEVTRKPGGPFEAIVVRDEDLPDSEWMMISVVEEPEFAVVFWAGIWLGMRHSFEERPNLEVVGEWEDISGRIGAETVSGKRIALTHSGTGRTETFRGLVLRGAGSTCYLVCYSTHDGRELDSYPVLKSMLDSIRLYDATETEPGTKR